MSQIEAGNIQLGKRPTDTEEIVKIAYEATRVQLEQRRIELRRQMQADLLKIIVYRKKPLGC